MSDADDLTQRCLALWTEYLTTLLADPRAIETLKRWMAFTGQFSYPKQGSSPPSGAPFPAWPPFFAPFGPPVAAPAADAPMKDGALTELANRLDEIEKRLTALEREAKPRRPHRAARGK
jgi:hypothetical protein